MDAKKAVGQQQLAHISKENSQVAGEQGKIVEPKLHLDGMRDSLAPSLTALQLASLHADKQTEQAADRQQIIRRVDMVASGEATPRSTLQGMNNSQGDNTPTVLIIKSDKSVASAQGTIDNQEFSVNGFVSQIEQNQSNNLGYESRLQNHRKTSTELDQRRNELIQYSNQSVKRMEFAEQLADENVLGEHAGNDNFGDGPSIEAATFGFPQAIPSPQWPNNCEGELAFRSAVTQTLNERDSPQAAQVAN